jgi:tryptophanase
VSDDLSCKTIFEPFKVKVVEPLSISSRIERERNIEKVNYNLFSLPAEQVTFDLLTDSGTSAMSQAQWSAMMIGDESYAGSRSFKKFERVVQDLTNQEYVIPTHQGRSAEDLLCRALLEPGKKVYGNTHFDTTRANIESSGCDALDLPVDEKKEENFKGNVDLGKLRKVLEVEHDKIPFFIMTITNNSVGGQPVSLENIEKTKELLSNYGIPLFIDAARFSENAWFNKIRTPGCMGLSTREIATKQFSYADGVLMSAKKDAFANIGGFIALSDTKLAEKIRNLMVITEGFPTYGGLAGRDLEALAVGLEEILNEDYLRYRIRSVEYFGEGIADAGLKVVKPFGGHAVYIDAGRTLPHMKPSQFPGQAMSVALYEFAGIRSVEVGSVMLGRKDPNTGEEIPAPKELVRLAMPRRVYTQSHVDFMIEKIYQLKNHLVNLPAYEFEYQAEFLRHFTARFRRTSLC